MYLSTSINKMCYKFVKVFVSIVFLNNKPNGKNIPIIKEYEAIKNTEFMDKHIRFYDYSLNINLFQ